MLPPMLGLNADRRRYAAVMAVAVAVAVAAVAAKKEAQEWGGARSRQCKGGSTRAARLLLTGGVGDRTWLLGAGSGGVGS